MPDMIHNIVYQFAKQLREIYGDELKKLLCMVLMQEGIIRKIQMLIL